MTPQSALNQRGCGGGAPTPTGSHSSLAQTSRSGLQHLIDCDVKVDCIVTSPPFYGQRDYGVDGQIGLEEHPSDFIESLVEVFDLCRKVLRTLGASGSTSGTHTGAARAHTRAMRRNRPRADSALPQDRRATGCGRPKQLLLIPHRFAIAMQDDGWLVRNDNVWVKPNQFQIRFGIVARCHMSTFSTSLRSVGTTSTGSGRSRVAQEVRSAPDSTPGSVAPSARATARIRLPSRGSRAHPDPGVDSDARHRTRSVQRLSGTSTGVRPQSWLQRPVGIDLSNECCTRRADAVTPLERCRSPRGV